MLLFAAPVFAIPPQAGALNPHLSEGRAKSQADALGYVPDPVDWSHLAPVPTKDVLPLRFDLRDSGSLTPVKYQSTCGACWAFAACGVLEGWLKIHNNETWDVSENHMKNTHGFELGPCAGGNNSISTAYLARGSGPVLESDDPYRPTQHVSPPGLQAQKLTTQAPVFTANGGDRSEIQYAIMTRGPLSTAMYYSQAHYDNTSRTYYSTAPPGSENHMVVAVGWDDEMTAPGAPGPGVWICRNSYGTHWGEGGYFYISYFDTLAVKQAVGFFELVPPETYGRIYQYDPLGITGYLGYGAEVAHAANVFTAETDETIAAVGTYAVANYTAYGITVHVGGIEGGGLPAPAVAVSGEFTHAGYYVVTLPEPVQVAAGQPFTVAIRYETPQWTFPVPIEQPVPDYAAPAAAPGQSYVSAEGIVFADLHNQGSEWTQTNVCIKALAAPVPAEEGEPPTPVVHIVGRWRVEVGDPVVLRAVVSTDIEPVHIEWRKDGGIVHETAVSNASDLEYLMIDVRLEDAGTYRVVITDAQAAAHESPPFPLQVVSQGTLPAAGVKTLLAAMALLSVLAGRLCVRRPKSTRPPH